MKALEKRNIGKSAIQTTILGFGALEIGRDWGLGSDTSRPDDNGAKAVLTAVLDSGINLIDTASAYHKSEERIGNFVANRRSEYVLASKCGEHNSEPSTYYDFSYKAVKDSIDNSLRLLKTDVIDVMQIHFGADEEKVLKDGETVAAMKDAKKEGKLQLLGASIDSRLARFCVDSGDFDMLQLGYSLLDRANAENITYCKEKGVGVFIRTGLAFGRLTERGMTAQKSAAKKDEKLEELYTLCDWDGDLLTAMALRFLYETEGITSILAGTKNPAHVTKNITLLERPVEQALYKRVLELTAK